MTDVVAMETTMYYVYTSNAHSCMDKQFSKLQNKCNLSLKLRLKNWEHQLNMHERCLIGSPVFAKTTPQVVIGGHCCFSVHA